MYAELLKHIATYGTLVGGIVYLAQYLFKTMIDKSSEFSLEKHKLELEKELEEFKNGLNYTNEEFKNKLQLISTEHHIKYSKLHETRANRIQNIYIRIRELEKSLINLTTIAQGSDWIQDSERDENARKEVEEFSDLIEINRIYLEQELYEKLHKLSITSHKIVWKMSSAKRKARYFEEHIKKGIHTERYDDSSDTWDKLEDQVSTEIVEAKIELIQDFREILGLAS